MVVSLLKEHKLPCGRGCGKVIRFESYKKHVQNKCLSHYEVTDSSSKVTMSDLLSRPTNLSATPTERKVAGNLVKKILNQNCNEGVLKVPMSGQVRLNYFIFLMTIDYNLPIIN